MHKDMTASSMTTQGGAVGGGAVATRASSMPPQPAPSARRNGERYVPGKLLSCSVWFAVVSLVLSVRPPEDEKTTALVEDSSKTVSLGGVTEFHFDAKTADLTAKIGDATLSLCFVAPGTLRLRLVLAPDAHFSDQGQRSPSLVQLRGQSVNATFVPVHGKNSFSLTSADGFTVVGTRNPVMLKLLWPDGTPVFEEARPIEWNKERTSQTLKGSSQETRVHGGGMQNGFFDHTNSLLSISEGGGWETGGRSNPAPFIMTTGGMGRFSDTFKKGSYDFRGGKYYTFSHDGHGMDTFFFASGDKKQPMKSVLSLYTSITGTAPKLPRTAFLFGDFACYNNEAHGFKTLSANDVLDGYWNNGFSLGYMSLNDGYGCGYTSEEQLKEVYNKMQDHNVAWTEWYEKPNPDDIKGSLLQVEKRDFQADAKKLDVAMVGHGYDVALDFLQQTESSMLNNGKRPFIFTTCGWASTGHSAIEWTGDNTGGSSLIEMVIPSVIGAGLSGAAFAGSDIDGIYGGSAESYVRDLQLHTFLPTAWSMSGWSEVKKRPWEFEDQYKEYNRQALKLRSQLLPYTYSLAHEAYLTGTPPVRAMSLEFPSESWHGDNRSHLLGTQFMYGPSFLVAPVFEKKAVTRNGITLPAGMWADYNTGEHMEGPDVLDGVDAPLSKIPTFVRLPSIIPMWPHMLQVPAKPPSELHIDVWPSPRVSSSSFIQYEDDGHSMKFKDGEVAKQEFSVSTDAKNAVTVSIGKSVGEYTDKPEKRDYLLRVHVKKEAAKVSLSQGTVSSTDFGADFSTVHVKDVPLSEDFSVHLEFPGDGTWTAV